MRACSNEEEKDAHDNHEPCNVLYLLPPAHVKRFFLREAHTNCVRMGPTHRLTHPKGRHQAVPDNSTAAEKEANETIQDILMQSFSHRKRVVKAHV